MHKRQVLRLGLAALILPTSVAATSPRTVPAATPISRMDLRWWRARFEAKQQELRSRRVDLIFLGDSITQDFETGGPPEWRNSAAVWQRFYGDRHAVNLGFKGDATSHLLWRVQNGEADGIAPKAAVILIGANNLGRLRWSAPDTVAGIEAIIRQLRQRLPNTRPLLLGVLPSERSAWATETTLDINRALAARFGQSDDVAYQDVSHVFMKDGRLNRDLFYDPRLTPPEPPLHPSAEGHALMAAAIEPKLAALLGDRPRK